MAANISPRVQDLLTTQSADTPVELHVLLRSDLSSTQLQAVADKLREICVPPAAMEVLRHNKMILCSTVVGAVPKIAQLPETFWIDMNTRAPIKELLDR